MFDAGKRLGGRLWELRARTPTRSRTGLRKAAHQSPLGWDPADQGNQGDL